MSKKSKELIKDLTQQLGWFVGDYIVRTHLPTLSTDMLLSNVVIGVDEELTNQWRKIEADYWKTRNDDIDHTQFYENRKWYKENIEDKYLEDELTVYVPGIYNFANKKRFVKAIEQALWDCDLSHYKAVDVTKTKFNGIYVKLQRSKT